MASTTPDQQEQQIAAQPTSWRVAVGAGLAVALFIGLFVAAFLWPITTASPQHIPLAVAGPQPAVAAVEQQLTARSPELFEVATVPDRQAAVAAIHARDVRGAIVLGQQPEILTASADSLQITQLLNQLGVALNAQLAAGGLPGTVTVTDVVPVGRAGQAVNIAILPVLIGGIAGAVVALVLVRTPIRRFATLGVTAAAGGLVGGAVLGPWFDVLPGNYWLVSAALAMGMLAIGAFVAGLGTLLGRAGILVAILLVVLVGNPWGAIFAPREFLTEPMATVGAYLPNGAAVELLRSISFFPGASTGGEWLVLAVWAAAGLIMLGAGAVWRRGMPNVATAAPATGGR
ncbi:MULTISPECIES: hypothetical protein [Thermocrispum]|jgi:hypothetical protein|uniref:ABC transporter permease n=2 Tax=Thermocrispum agreste TaxID=37925 RepID=A0ABD6FIB7_9PSEU|nr:MULTISPECIES: hypothetical protein [Thermocrispum]